MERPPIGLREDARKNWLSFKGSVTNEDVQAFWVASFSRESLLKTRGRENGQATETVQRLRDTIRAILGPELEPDVNIDATFPQPVLRFRGKDLNFSQLAAGFNSTLAWITDYLLRQELFDWGDGQRAKDRPGVILIDEIETHLHPQWQRRILNGIRTAFPTTQIIIATHSPFVVSSCKEARVHVFKVDDRGRAYLDRSIDDPDAVSVAATVQDVFEIASQFGPEIEGKLREWNELKKRDSVGRLSAREKTELKKRTRDLASRGEELALMVHETVLPEALLEELIEAASSKRR